MRKSCGKIWTKTSESKRRQFNVAIHGADGGGEEGSELPPMINGQWCFVTVKWQPTRQKFVCDIGVKYDRDESVSDIASNSIPSQKSQTFYRFDRGWSWSDSKNEHRKAIGNFFRWSFNVYGFDWENKLNLFYEVNDKVSSHFAESLSATFKLSQSKFIRLFFLSKSTST